MSEIELLLMEKLAAKETPADTDTMIVAEGNVLKKSTIAQLVTFLKEKLGVNSLNTKLNDYVMVKSFTKLIALSNGRGNADFTRSACLHGVGRCAGNQRTSEAQQDSYQHCSTGHIPDPVPCGGSGHVYIL